MFACLYLRPPVRSSIGDRPSSIVRSRRSTIDNGRSPIDDGRWTIDDRPFASLVQVAREFSPRIETYDRLVTLDISGLGSLIGEPRAIGEELRRAAADAGLAAHVAVAATSTAAMLLAHARAGLTVVPRGEEGKALAPLPLDLLDHLASARKPSAPNTLIAPELKRWGLRTLGELAALPSADLSARLGQTGLRWQRWARGEEMRPLVPAGSDERFEESLDLEWPIDGLEPLSFVLARLLDPLCERLAQRDRGAVVLRVTLVLVTSGEGGRELHERVIELPAPMRDARVLRTLALLDLESNPPAAAIDRVAVAVDVTEGRVLQFGLLARALPTETLATLTARLSALMGGDRIGSPALVDTYRPGAFAMAKFDPKSPIPNPQSPIPNPGCSPAVVRRLRSPVPARVTLEQGRPVRVTTDRRGFSGGRVERCEGPWRSSGDWWKNGWNCDEWDMLLGDGVVYRISYAHDRQTWFVEGLID